MLASQYTFGVSEWELFHTLTAGATLLVCKEELVRRPAALAIAVAPCALLFLVPSHLDMLLPTLGDRTLELNLRHVVCCGEALLQRTADSFHTAVAGHEHPPQLHNLYGPTEGSMTYHTCVHGAPTILIGEPIHNTTVWLLDSTMQLAPVGTPAEVVFGGIVAAGYLGQPELTAIRFIKNPLLTERDGSNRLLSELGLDSLAVCHDAAVPASPIVFQTGDLAVRLSSGALRYIGRIDRQVKIRGVRVEPGEVEAVARSFWKEGRVDVSAVAMGDELVLFVAIDPLDRARGLRSHCERLLPRYMVPTRIIGVRSLPRLPSGKIDTVTLCSGTLAGEFIEGAFSWPEARLAPSLSKMLPFGSTQYRADLEAAVLRLVCGLSSTPLASISADTPLMDAGVDSATAIELSTRLRLLVGIALWPTIVFEQPTPSAIASHVLARASSATVVSSAPTLAAGSCATLALLGMTTRWPGGLGSETERYAALYACGDAVGGVPLARWMLETSVDTSLLSETQKRCIQFGGFVGDAQRFDAHAFEISQAEVVAMDPQQRLLCEHAYVALHRSVRRRATLMGGSGGVFLGIEQADWAFVQPPTVRNSVYAVTGDNASVAAGRLSFLLDMQGPCSSLDMACASALVALHWGSYAVRTHECEHAIAEAVSLKLIPHSTLGAASAGMLSVDGRCKTLDARADGYVRSEGVSAFVMQRGMDEGVLVICSSAVRQDGRSASLTAPNGSAQRVLLLAALGRASVSLDQVGCTESHGTGTALGDPTEVGALASVHGERTVAIAVGAAKANVGHAEAVSGQVGMLKLGQMLADVAAGNAQLRVLNPLVGERLREISSRFVLPMQAVATRGATGGVSSFGYSGTIAHAVSQYVGMVMRGAGFLLPSLLYRHRSFPWCCRLPHPFAQCYRRTLDAHGNAYGDVRVHTFSTPMGGSLHALVAGHVVQDRIVFPGAAYLEMARAAVASSSTMSTALRSVFFLAPLVVIEAIGRRVEITVSSDGQFEVRGGYAETDADSLVDISVHCSGKIETRVHGECQNVDYTLCRSGSNPRAADVCTLYDGFDRVGLHYGPQYRTLKQTWGGDHVAVARLQTRRDWQGTETHPADLDDALCTAGITSSNDAEASLPFAMDTAQLYCTRGKLWAAAESTEATPVILGTKLGQPAAQLVGVTSRTLPAIAVQIRRHLYTTKWLHVDTADSVLKALLMIGNGRLVERNLHGSLARPRTDERAAAILVLWMRHKSSLAPPSLLLLEVALALVQTMPMVQPTPTVCLLTSRVHAAPLSDHVGLWGMARSARAEALLPLACIESKAAECLACGPSQTEPEIAHHYRERYMPRLRRASLPSFDGLVRLHFHSRGAISHLFLQPQVALPSAPAPSHKAVLSDAEVLLSVRSVGLNFRDVLNVLGEYPGDPGSPGDDTAGLVHEVASSPQLSAFGLAHAPLACLALASAPFIVEKPSELSFEQACTLPVTWSTAHAVVERAMLCAGSLIIVHAAAGGVGLKAVEYVQWLAAASLCTAGRPQKHAGLCAIGAADVCSSRDGVAFALGAAQRVGAGRSHAVLNSLSTDFLAASFALLGESGSFEEIGKRGVWAVERHLASASACSYSAVALDTEMAQDPGWMHGVFVLLKGRAETGALTSVPFRSLSFEMQYELAFRILQQGVNTGKVVVRMVARSSSHSGTHLVTGGTGGLGLLTSRWLAQRGARRLVLASRSGAFMQAKPEECGMMQAGGATISLTLCDMSELMHIERLITLTSPMTGVWHAAGKLADALLPRQDLVSLVQVYGPKAHGAWGLHSACSTMSTRTFALFSSVAALLSSIGQANYAAANSCLDALASCCRGLGRATVSVQWGAWAEVGMATRGAANKRTAALEAVSGFEPISLAQGLAALCVVVGSNTPPMLGVMPIVWSRFFQGSIAAPAFVSAFAPIINKLGTVGPSATAVCGVSTESVLELVRHLAGNTVDTDTPLIEAGIDSLGAVELRNQLQGASDGPPLPSTLVFDQPTVRKLASVLQNRAEPLTAPHLSRMEPAEWEVGVPVQTSSLQDLWLMHQWLYPDSNAYNYGLSIPLGFGCPTSNVRAALKRLAVRHVALRTLFRLSKDTRSFVQIVMDEDSFNVPLTSGSHELFDNELARPFDLSTSVPMRAHLEPDDCNTTLWLILHHVAFDAEALDIIKREVPTLCRRAHAFANGDAFSALDLPQTSISYMDYLIRCEEQGEDDMAVSWWTAKLAGATTLLELPLDCRRSNAAVGLAGYGDVTIATSLARALRKTCATLAVTATTGLLCVFAALMLHLSNQGECLVSVPHSLRHREELLNMVGCLVNFLPLRLNRDGSYAQAVRNAQAEMLELLKHAHVPVSDIQSAIGSSKLFNVTFQLASYRIDMSVIQKSTILDLDVMLGDASDGSITGFFIFNADLFYASTVDRWIACFQTILSGAVATPHKLLHQLPSLTRSQFERLMAFHGAVQSFPSEMGLHDLVAAQVSRRRSVAALEWNGSHMSYAELQQSTNNLASCLRTCGVAADQVVALQMTRCIEMVIGLLGILMAPGAFVPLDPALPQRRRRFMIGDASCACMVTQTMHAEQLPLVNGHVFVLNNFSWAPVETTNGSIDPPTIVFTPNDLAYIMYTSGSSGVPKGVMAPHKGVVNLLNSTHERYPIDEKWIFGLSTNYTFDPFVRKLFTCLGMLGGTCVLLDSGLSLASLSDTANLTHLGDVPSVMALAAVPQAVRHVDCAGEAMTQSVIDNLRRHVCLYNYYGPTECSIDVTGRCVAREDLPRALLSIGRALSNVQCFCVETQTAQLVPIGVYGELWLGGVQVTRGYLNRPDLTAKSFIASPWVCSTLTECDVVYRTGDLVRWYPDGELEFNGRMDSQIKLNGVRIELGEIEHALRALPGVLEAVVLVINAALVAYVQPRSTSESIGVVYSMAQRFNDVPGLSGIRYLLPQYMLPSLVVGVTDWPRTASSKVDRKQLPLPRLAENQSAFNACTDVSQALGLTRMQQSFYMGRFLQEPSMPCHAYIEFDVCSLNVEKLRSAVACVVARHPSLRARLDDEGRQFVDSAFEFTISVVDELSSEQRRRFISGKDAKGKDLFWAINLTRLGSGITRMHVLIDLMFIDVASQPIVVEEVLRSYFGLPLPPLPPRRFEEFVFRKLSLRPSPASTAYWKERLVTLPRNAPALHRTANDGRNRINMANRFFDGISTTLEAETWQTLKQQAIDLEVTAEALVIALLLEALALRTTPSFTIVVTCEGRPTEPDFAAVVGNFTDAILFSREEAAGVRLCTVASIVRSVDKQLAEARKHTSVSVGDLVQEMNLEQTVTFPIVFTSHLPASPGWHKVAELVHQQSQSPSNIPWDKPASGHWLQTTPQTELDMQCMETRGTLALMFDFDPNSFDRGTIEALLSTWRDFLCRVAMESNLASTELSNIVSTSVRDHAHLDFIDGSFGSQDTSDSCQCPTSRLAPVNTFSRGVVTTDSIVAAEISRVRQTVAEVLKVPETTLDSRRSLSEQGLTSLHAIRLSRALSAVYTNKLPATIALMYPTVERLAKHIASLSAAPTLTIPAAPPPVTHLSIFAPSTAFDNICCHLPISSLDSTTPHGLSVYERVLSVGCGVSPGIHFPDEVFQHNAAALTYALPGAQWFDNDFFGISPAEAFVMDPQQRVLLECVRGSVCIQHKDELCGSGIGVYLGMWASEFAQVVPTSPIGNSLMTSMSVGCSATAGRISFALGLHGPCVSYDTACCSALVACNAAVAALRERDCESGLLAAVNLVFSPHVCEQMSIAGFTSKEGEVRVFDAGADGYVRAEACGVAHLRCIGPGGSTSAFVAASSVRQDGRSASLTAPNGLAQRELLRATRGKVNVAAGSICAIEAHGTATLLGDPVEVEALMHSTVVEQISGTPLAISGVKAVLGHAEPAAAMNGCMRVAVGWLHRWAMPNVQLRLMNPHVKEGVHGRACHLPVQLAKLPCKDGSDEFVGVSSFGSGGTIAHALIMPASNAKFAEQDRAFDPLAFKLSQPGLWRWPEVASRFRLPRLIMDEGYLQRLFARKSYKRFEREKMIHTDALIDLVNAARTQQDASIHQQEHSVEEHVRPTLQQLGKLLAGLAQYTSPELALPKHRYAAAGSLYSTRAYVFIANADADNRTLPAGLFYYDPVSHELVMIQSSGEMSSSVGAHAHSASTSLLMLVAVDAALRPVYQEASDHLKLLNMGYALGVIESCSEDSGISLRRHDCSQMLLQQIGLDERDASSSFSFARRDADWRRRKQSFTMRVVVNILHDSLQGLGRVGTFYSLDETRSVEVCGESARVYLEETSPDRDVNASTRAAASFAIFLVPTDVSRDTKSVLLEAGALGHHLTIASSHWHLGLCPIGQTFAGLFGASVVHPLYGGLVSQEQALRRELTPFVPFDAREAKKRHHKSIIATVPLLGYRRSAFPWRTSSSPIFMPPALRSEQLLRPSSGIADMPLMDAGLTSQALMQLVLHIRRMGGCSVLPTLIFDFPTVRAIAKHLADEGLGVVGVAGDTMPIHSYIEEVAADLLPPLGVPELLQASPQDTAQRRTSGPEKLPQELLMSGPLGFSQRFYLTMNRDAPDVDNEMSPSVLISVSAELHSSDFLASALRALCSAHDILRTTYYEDPLGRLYQCIIPDDQFDFPLVYRDAPADAEAAKRAAVEFIRRGCDLFGGPSLHCLIMRATRHSSHHWAALAVHHVASDAMSISILLDELNSMLERKTVSIHTPTFSFLEYCLWQRMQFQSEKASIAAYCREKAKVFSLPNTDSFCSPIPVAAQTERTVVLDVEYDLLEMAARALSATVPEVLYVVFSFLICWLLEADPEAEQVTGLTAQVVAGREDFHSMGDAVGAFFYVPYVMHEFRRSQGLREELLQVTRELVQAKWYARLTERGCFSELMGYAYGGDQDNRRIPTFNLLDLSVKRQKAQSSDAITSYTFPELCGEDMSWCNGTYDMCFYSFIVISENRELSITTYGRNDAFRQALCRLFNTLVSRIAHAAAPASFNLFDAVDCAVQEANGVSGSDMDVSYVLT